MQERSAEFPVVDESGHEGGEVNKPSGGQTHLLENEERRCGVSQVLFAVSAAADAELPSVLGAGRGLVQAEVFRVQAVQVSGDARFKCTKAPPRRAEPTSTAEDPSSTCAR